MTVIVKHKMSLDPLLKFVSLVEITSQQVIHVLFNMFEASWCNTKSEFIYFYLVLQIFILTSWYLKKIFVLILWYWSRPYSTYYSNCRYSVSCHMQVVLNGIEIQAILQYITDRKTAICEPANKEMCYLLFKMLFCTSVVLWTKLMHY